MITLKSLLFENINKISLQTAVDKKMFGPVFHGTTSDNREKIDREGFKIFVGNERGGDIKNGFETSDYSGGIPAPIHMLGFGIYFTTSKNIAKKFNNDTTSGLKAYFIDAHHLETINWGSPNTMMKWWKQNGYDYKINPQTKFNTMMSNDVEWGRTEKESISFSEIQSERLRATKNLTKELSSKYDAVWYKGKGIYRLLDGDQVVVFDPRNIYVMDKLLIKPGEIGSKVIAKIDIDPYNRGEIVVPKGTVGILTHKDKPTEFQKWAEGSSYIYRVKFKPGGDQYNLTDNHIEPYVKKK